MSTASRQLWSQDPWGQLGRGLAYVLALAMPFLARLDAVVVAGDRPFPVASLLALLIPMMAVASSSTGGANRVRGRWVLPIVLAAGLASGLGAARLGGDAVYAVAAVWEPMLLVAGIAMLFAGHPFERAGLLVTLAISTTVAVLLGYAEWLRIPGFGPLLRIFHDAPETWQLIERLTGPLSHADALSWLCAVMLPVIAAGAAFLNGKPRDIVLLVIGLLWLGALLTLSYGAPIASLAGLIVVMSWKPGLRRSLGGLTVPLLLGLAVAMLWPGFRARWGPYDKPVGFVVRAMTSLEGGEITDSLNVTLVNPGPTTWQAGYETGYHLLFPETDIERGTPRLLRGGWVGVPMGEPVGPGDEVSLTVPFHSPLDRGFIVWDLKGPGGTISEHNGSPYMLLFEAEVPGSRNRVGRLMHVRSPEFVSAANEVLQRGSVRAVPSITEVWGDIYGLLEARPWLGLGPGASKSMLGYNARNLFLEIAVGAGWIGLGLFVVLILVLNAALLMHGTLEGYALSGALFAAVLHGMSAYAFDDPSARTAAMVLLGLAWAAAFSARRTDSDDPDAALDDDADTPGWLVTSRRTPERSPVLRLAGWWSRRGKE